VKRWISLLILLVATTAVAPPASSQSKDNLYKRLGGYDAIAAVTDDMLGRLIADPQLSRFFVGLNDVSKTRIRQHFVDFLCKATGGPCAYTGQDMKTAHAGINITEQDWAAAVKDLQATLDKFKVPERERGEVLTMVSGLKGDIVHGM
jgi:hemoglobin